MIGKRELVEAVASAAGGKMTPVPLPTSPARADDEACRKSSIDEIERHFDSK
jgi:hypothetical protein